MLLIACCRVIKGAPELAGSRKIRSSGLPDHACRSACKNAAVSAGPSTVGLVGREPQLTQLHEVIERARESGAVALVVGQAGIGKTSLVRAIAGRTGRRVGWGTCLDSPSAPGYWPWTQALNALARTVGLAHARDTASDDLALLGVIVSALNDPENGSEGSVPLLLWDATARWLQALAVQGPLLIVLDDLQWADDSSLALFEFIATSCRIPGVCLIGLHRPDALSAQARERLSIVVSHADHIQLDGLDADAVHSLVGRVVGAPVSAGLSADIHRRSGGHPFFVRELALTTVNAAASTNTAPPASVPGAVREAIERRLRHLSGSTLGVLEVSAMIGNEVLPDVIVQILGLESGELEAAIHEALAAGVMVTGDDGELRLAHDLLRETLATRVDPVRRVVTHQAIAAALEQRIELGFVANAAEIARHFTNAIGVDGPQRATRWALAAASDDSRALAFTEAAGHLRRLRASAAAARVVIAVDAMIDVLIAEADALVRSGSPLDAKGLLRVAHDLAQHSKDVHRLASVALAATQLGSQFSARRDDVIADLEEALTELAAADLAMEARLTATLARELQHSVASDRPRAEPLSRRALELGRQSDDADALLACLLARHDVLWTPGTAQERVSVAQEIIVVSRRLRDPEREAQGLLLLANAELERGSALYLAALDECLVLLDELGQPRHRYTAETRRAAVDMLHGDLDSAAHRIEMATALGRRIREPDTDNVRMSQMLELVRARNRTEELQAFAIEAVQHWTGAPVHANAVAAGFHARAGDLERARWHTMAVLDLGTWRADRSYLWSVFVRELSWAAIALHDHDLCTALFNDVEPLVGGCGVNGAFVAFAGSYAQTAGMLTAELGRGSVSDVLLADARALYERLGARLWLAEVESARAASAEHTRSATSNASLKWMGAFWEITFDGRRASIADSKGLRDLASLLAKPGVDVHALELMGSSDRSGAAGTLVDRAALDSYRRRLVDLDEDVHEAERHNDGGRVERLALERDALLAELKQVTGLGGQPRQFANHPAERARKAVSARIRMAIATIGEVLPQVREHLDRTIVTGNQCRYAGSDTVSWTVSTNLELKVRPRSDNGI